MKAPVIAEALAGAHRAEWCLRVDRYHGANAARWPADVVAGLVKSQDEWLSRMGRDAVEIVGETDACLFIDGAWWCCVVWHWVDANAPAVGWAKPGAQGAEGVPTNDEQQQIIVGGHVGAAARRLLSPPYGACADCGG